MLYVLFYDKRNQGEREKMKCPKCRSEHTREAQKYFWNDDLCKYVVSEKINICDTCRWRWKK